MKYIILIIFLIVTRLPLEAQTVHFVELNNWNDVITKAKNDSKPIFVDIYATWCGPCKMMDQNVYNNSSVATILNENFLCIKIQADRTTKDDLRTQGWYNTIDKFKKDYNIRAMPTFLFFNSDGNILSKEIGYRDTSQVVKMVKDALNPDKQYYTLLKSYQNGNIKSENIPELAYQARLVADEDNSKLIAGSYIENKLFNGPESDLFNKKNLIFISAFMQNTESKSFKFFNNNKERINSILGENAAQVTIRRVISSQYVPSEESWDRKEPNWTTIYNIASEKFGELGGEAVNGEKMVFYFNKRKWKEFGEAYHLYFRTALRRPAYNINDVSFKLFENVTDTKILKFACDVVMKYALEEWYQNNVAAYDTYANLLYKTDRVEKALEWEERAAKIGKGTPDEKDLLDNLNKMKKGEPTWNINSKN